MEIMRYKSKSKIMKSILQLLLIYFLFTSCKDRKTEDLQTDQQAVAAVEKLVQNLFDEVWAGYDETAIKKYQTENFLLLEHGEIWNNDTIANWCKNAKKRDQKVQRINNFERIEARRNGDKLWIAYHNYGTFIQDTVIFKRSWLESVVAVKEDSLWKLELMHSTRQPVE
jgi:hypothetical protein